ncbi:hypothetical protein [Hyphomicrobium sp.]|uniref:hypothetical protein n=1 Tax=Hyphomicrobium sp. TaxID=82 RepID=UPI001DAC59C3|nr:hypothetical protein [Hyphomicrobium sp.]MBY0559534.1 hypothetical protein [Hyphomicrobium sp.]
MRGHFLPVVFCAVVGLIANSPLYEVQAGSAGATTTPAEPAAPQKANDAAETKSADVPLSKKLDENKGVLKPPQGVDPGIHQPPPAHTGDKMPVIVPPGEPGGDQSVQPK